MNLLEEYRERLAVLKNVHFRDVTGRLVDILEWLEREPVFAQILTELKQACDINALFNHGAQERPTANTREEIARVGMHLIEICRIRKLAFYSVCMEYGISPPHRTSAVQDYTNAGLQDYVVPFFVFVEKRLIRESEKFSVAALAEGRLAYIVATGVRTSFPQTTAALDQIATEFLRPDPEVRWQNVGNSCRQTLIEFGTELRAACGTELPTELKEADVKGILRFALGKICAPGRFRKTLEGLIDGVWNHAQSVVHRPATTREEAARLYLWTGLLVSEFAMLVRAFNEG